MPALRSVLATALLASLLAAGCGGGGEQGASDAGGTGGAHANVDWPRWGNDAGNGHFARLDQIDRGNVDRLRLAWSVPGPRRQIGWETFPIVVDGTMYYDTGTDQVFAVDAATGRRLWSYAPAVDLLAAPGVRPPTPVSRGVTYGAGRIYVVTGDARLIALDARNGRELWQRRVADPGIGNAMNSPGTFWRGEIVVGGPAGAAGLRGFVAAYRAGDGRPLWRAHMVPRRGSSWRRGPGSGGGNVWMPPTIEPRSGTVYVATGNPSPGFDSSGRRGCNPMANAVVALDGASGEVLWSRTLVCEDSWDYDTVQSPLIFGAPPLGGDGEPVELVGAASKAGFYATFEAERGRPIARTPYLTRYSRPHRRPTRSGVVVCPGIYGGLEYGPPAYSPRDGLVYQPGNQMCMRYRLAPRARGILAGEDDLGGTARQVGPATGMVAAFDPWSGAVRWKRKLPAPANGGALATAGGLVFLGEDDGYLRALDSSDGTELWRHRLGLRVGSAPIAYEVDGVEYLAIAAGGSLVQARGTVPTRPPRLFVFALPH
ncbi:MAG: pyrroloquinoline quinone-dependent dehydrogenase [Solirubrobacterales bacterium]